MHHCRTVVLCLVVLSALLLAPSAFAERIYVTPGCDGYISTTSSRYYPDPYTSYHSTETALRLSYGSDGLGNYNDSQARISIPISSLRGRNLDGASIMLNLYSDTRALVYLSGGCFDGDGTPFAGGLVFPSSVRIYPNTVPGATLTVGWSSHDATSYVKAQLASGYSWATFRMIIAEPSLAWIGAAEDPQGTGAYLDYTLVPEPSSLLALFAGASCLGGMIVRRRK